MHISDLLLIKLENDIEDYFNDYYKSNNLKINKTIYNKIIKKFINNKIKDINFLNSEKKYKNTQNRCCARIWDNHYGTRCRYKVFKDNDYCKHHLNLIEKKGKLLFNRYDEPKPLFNDKNNPIPWEKFSKIDILDNILQDQWSNMETIIKYNLHKQRQITP